MSNPTYFTWLCRNIARCSKKLIRVWFVLFFGHKSHWLLFVFLFLFFVFGFCFGVRKSFLSLLYRHGNNCNKSKLLVTRYKLKRVPHFSQRLPSTESFYDANWHSKTWKDSHAWSPSIYFTESHVWNLLALNWFSIVVMCEWYTFISIVLCVILALF